MSRRRDEGVQDALELFLDTISNMFGGVLFIALAVVVLLQFSVAVPRQPVDEPAATDRETLEAEVVALEALMEPHRFIAARPQVDPDAISEATHRLAADRRELEALRERAQELQQVLAGSRDESQQIVAELAAVSETLRDTQDRLAEARARPPQRLRAARYRETDKREVPWLLLGGRLTPVLALTPDGSLRGVDRDALIFDAESSTVRPRAAHGAAIGADIDTQTRLTGLLRALNPERDYVALAVWPDSFDQAAVVRDTLIDLGFEYGLYFVPEGEGVPFNAAGGVQ